MSAFPVRFLTGVSIVGMLLTGFGLPGILQAGSRKATKGKSLKTRSFSIRGGKSIRRKLKDIILDHVELEEASITTVITYLRQRSKELDTEGTGVNIILLHMGDKVKHMPAITLVLDQIPLEDAIKYVCMASGLQYRIDEYTVVIYKPKDKPKDKKK